MTAPRFPNVMNAETDDITGVILVGGRSRRMGVDKALVEVHGLPLFERVLAAFRRAFPHLLLVGDRPERFARHGVPQVPDVYPGSALGGLYTGLLHATTPFVFVAPCDLPFPSVAAIRTLCALRRGFDVVVPVTEGGPEPLFALYGKNCLPAMREALDNGRLAVRGIFPQLSVRSVALPELGLADADEAAFFNLNTPEDLLRARRHIPPQGT